MFDFFKKEGVEARFSTVYSRLQTDLISFVCEYTDLLSQKVDCLRTCSSENPEEKKLLLEAFQEHLSFLLDYVDGDEGKALKKLSAFFSTKTLKKISLGLDKKLAFLLPLILDSFLRNADTIVNEVYRPFLRNNTFELKENLSVHDFIFILIREIEILSSFSSSLLSLKRKALLDKETFFFQEDYLFASKLYDSVFDFVKMYSNILPILHDTSRPGSFSSLVFKKQELVLRGLFSPSYFRDYHVKLYGIDENHEKFLLVFLNFYGREFFEAFKKPVEVFFFLNDFCLYYEGKNIYGGLQGDGEISFHLSPDAITGESFLLVFAHELAHFLTSFYGASFFSSWECIGEAYFASPIGGSHYAKINLREDIAVLNEALVCALYKEKSSALLTTLSSLTPVVGTRDQLTHKAKLLFDWGFFPSWVKWE